MAHGIAGGAESMSFIPEATSYLDYAVAKAGNEDYYWGMGLTAEASCNKVSREDQDEFAYHFI
jgi:acetyl-CoA acyltransferase